MKTLVFIVIFVCYCFVPSLAAGEKGLHYQCDSGDLDSKCCTAAYDCNDYIDKDEEKHKLSNKGQEKARLCDCDKKTYKCVNKNDDEKASELLGITCFREGYPFGYEWVYLDDHINKEYDDEKGKSFLCQENSPSKFEAAPDACCKDDKCEFYVDRGETKKSIKNTRQRARLCSCEDKMQKCLAEKEHSEADRIKTEYCIHEKKGKYAWIKLSEYQKSSKTDDSDDDDDDDDDDDESDDKPVENITGALRKWKENLIKKLGFSKFSEHFEKQYNDFRKSIMALWGRER